MRRVFVCLLALSSITAPLRAGAGAPVEVRDEGEGGFRLELPPPGTPTRTIRQGAEWTYDESGAGAGYVRVVVDTFPVAVYLDGVRMVFTGPEQGLALPAGRHFVSFFPPKQVYLAYRAETPEVFWQRVLPEGGLPGARFGLLASYEGEAVRAGTRWLQVVPEETLAVQLSRQEMRRTYQRHGMTAALTFFSIATVLAAAMFGSAALLAGE